MKKRLFIYLMFTLGLSLQVLAGDETKNTSEIKIKTCISGKVVDMLSGEALTGALVKIEGTQLSTYTDFEGNFSFEGIAPGKYCISTSFISYQPETIKPIELHENEVHSLNLNLKASN